MGVYFRRNLFLFLGGGGDMDGRFSLAAFLLVEFYQVF